MAKRLNLLEFQQSLIDRLQVTDKSATQATTLGVQIAGNNWLVDMQDISVVMLLPHVTIAPFTKPWFLGLANIRGNLYSVVDMAGYQSSTGVLQLDSTRASGEASNRVLVVAERFSFNVALLVDRVLGLRDSRNWRKKEGDGNNEYIDEQDKSWRKLDVQSLLLQQEFLQIGV